MMGRVLEPFPGYIDGDGNELESVTLVDTYERLEVD